MTREKTKVPRCLANLPRVASEWGRAGRGWAVFSIYLESQNMDRRSGNWRQVGIVVLLNQV